MACLRSITGATMALVPELFNTVGGEAPSTLVELYVAVRQIVL